MADKFLVGDKVWDIRYGWGKVIKIIPSDKFPVKVDCGGGLMPTYTLKGESSLNSYRTLFFEEIKIQESACIRPRWKADTGDSYFCIDTAGEVVKYTQGDSSYDAKRYKAKNYFQTREEAKESPIYEVFNGGR